jgi:glycosyltransferase involved in cell wall biosynthesis
METTRPAHSPPRRIALIGNYLPRQCGIATFTADLLAGLASENPDGECWAVAMNDVPEGYGYPGEVRFEINQRALSDYPLAADFLNINRVEVACLQHEYGIFGGEHGAHILDLVGNLAMPLVTTFHTVIQDPAPALKTATMRIAQLSDRVVVMSHRAVDLLHGVYGIPGRKISLIHHGIPDVPFVDPSYYKDQYGVEGRKVILTFGLLSPGKGVETMIDALPRVVRDHPDVVYIILGATHPHVRREQGERYRLSLQARARERGVADHVIFHNRFVDSEELREFLGAADVYVTPYLNREQIVSGTLAYAMGSGKATVSTPYWYAEEMLAEGRGRIVPFQDSEQLAGEVNDLFTNEVERHAIRKRAYTYCRNMVWKEVARQYLQLFEDARQERQSFPRPVRRARVRAAALQEMPQPCLDHVIRMTDDVGILQHARYVVPDRAHGYCTDDNARGLLAVLLANDMTLDSDPLDRLATTYVSFLNHAFNAKTGRFRNFMSYDRRWVEEVGSDDCHARAVWSLGEAVSLAASEDIRSAARGIFERALPALDGLRSPRAWAFALVGLRAYQRRFAGDSEVRRLRERLSGKLLEIYRAVSAPDWLWVEDTVTYASGKVPQALILSGSGLGNEEMRDAGLRILEWLLEIQTDPRGHFVPVGNRGWYPRGGEKARFDQQPLEALHMIEACREAYEVTRDPKWTVHAETCLQWFFGRNDLNAQLYDHKTGGCSDGLGADGPNRNKGAESTLVCLLSMLTLNQLRASEISNEAVAATQEEGVHGS